jgi:hypothetical protein
MTQAVNLITTHERLPFKAMIAHLAQTSPVLEDLGGIQTISDQQKLYKSPPGYLSWETHLKLCASHLSPVVMDAAAKSGSAIELITVRNCLAALKHKAPARYISKEICEAFVNTSIPEPGAEIANIFPALHIFLPRNYLFDWEGCEVTSLILQSNIVRPEGKPVDNESRAHEKMVANKITGGKVIVLPPGAVNVPKIDIAAVTATGFICTVSMPYEIASSNRCGSAYEPPDRMPVYKAIERIAVNSLMAHLYEPELITVESFAPVSSGRGFGKGSGPSPLPVTWIGKTFRYQRDKSQEPGETRNSVRSHWRRGHWHTVLHGQKRQQRRTQWFKPIYVGSK